jgi:hypothetical protein
MICTNDIAICNNEAKHKLSFKVKARRGIGTDCHVFYLCPNCFSQKEDFLYQGYYDYLEKELNINETS